MSSNESPGTPSTGQISNRHEAIETWRKSVQAHDEILGLIKPQHEIAAIGLEARGCPGDAPGNVAHIGRIERIDRVQPLGRMARDLYTAAFCMPGVRRRP